MIYRAKDRIIFKYGCKDCHHAKIRTENVEYQSCGKKIKKRAAVIDCPFDQCPYFSSKKSFKDFLDKKEYEAQFELETGLDMNDFKGMPGDIR